MVSKRPKAEIPKAEIPKAAIQGCWYSESLVHDIGESPIGLPFIGRCLKLARQRIRTFPSP